MARAAASWLLLAVVSAPSPASASGEAGTTYLSKYYRLGLSAGVRKIVDGDSSYFEDEEKAYLRRLDPLVPRINRLVEEARAGLGLSAYDPDSPHVGRASAHLRGNDGERVALAVTFANGGKHEGLDKLAASVARLIAAAHRDDDDAPLKGKSSFAPTAPVVIDHPGMRLTVRAESPMVDATYATQWLARHEAYARRVQTIVLAELRASPEVGLPAGWPEAAVAPRSKESPTLHMMFGGLAREVVVSIPVDHEIPEKVKDEARKRVAVKLYRE